MAKKKKEEAKKGSPAWMNTFSDLMNLLLCFFVLLFSMSTVDKEKFQHVIASLQSSMSILPAGGSSVGDGEMISAGVRQLEQFDTYYSEIAEEEGEEGESGTSQSVYEAYKEQELQESEQMAEDIQSEIEKYGLQDQIDVDFNGDYVQLNISGAILFGSGETALREEAYPIIDKISLILEGYDKNIIEVEGHTDNVPIHSSKYESNDVLSMYRALNVVEYIRTVSDINPAYIKSTGRGEHVPIADNATPEGRARNRRVEIKIYNSYNSDID